MSLLVAYLLSRVDVLAVTVDPGVSALVVILVGACMPVVLAFTTHRLARADRREMWKRQDTIEAKQNTMGKTLDIVHTLVNSDKTAAYERELASTRRELVSLRHIMKMGQAAGIEPGAEERDVIAGTENRIAELERTLVQRAEQAATIEAQEEIAASMEDTDDRAS